MSSFTRKGIITAIIALSGHLAVADEKSTDRQDTAAGQQPEQSRSEGAPASSQSATAASGTKVQFNQLPGAVQKTMRSEAGGFNIENVQKISKNGQACYQATFDKGPLKGQLTVGEDGSLLTYQESASFAMFQAAPSLESRRDSTLTVTELPQAVRDAVKQRAGTNEVANVFKTTLPQSQDAAYHVAYTSGSVLTDLLIDEQGKIIYRADQTALVTAPLQGAQSMSFSSAPQPVQQAIRQHGGAQAVTDIDKGTWNGQTVYKAMVNVNGSPRPLLISESGEILRAKNRQASGAGAESEQGEQGQSSPQPLKKQDSAEKADNE